MQWCAPDLTLHGFHKLTQATISDTSKSVKICEDLWTRSLLGPVARLRAWSESAVSGVPDFPRL